MKMISLFCLLLTAFFTCRDLAQAFPEDFPLSRKLSAPALAPKSASREAPESADDQWISMPAGGKPAYMGIHGGTMPVSLLVSRDGSSLFTFVGRTGNDFLEALRKAFTFLPSIGNSTLGVSMPPRGLRTELFAGNATASLPVIALSGDRLANQSWFRQLQPFGLSAKPLRIEGEAVKPNAPAPARGSRLFFLPDYFQPRRGAR